MNTTLAQNVVLKLLEVGCREFVICAGARNAPLVGVLNGFSAVIRRHFFFEERSAAFFALGRIKASGSPVAVVTTSGTAVAELLPATIEAHYVGAPLVLLTADRPRAFRGTAAPQAIEQVGIFGSYVHESFDLARGDEVVFSREWQGPVHVNVCFEEPTAHEAAPQIIEKQILEKLAKFQQTSVKIDLVDSSNEKKIESSKVNFPSIKNPLVLIGPLAREWQKPVREWLERTQIPFVAEALSGLQGFSELNRLKCGERFIEWELRRRKCDGIIRVGGVPTARLWRDLEGKWREIPVVTLAHVPFSGLARGNNLLLPLSSLALVEEWLTTEIGSPKVQNEHEFKEGSEADQQIWQKKEQLAKTLPLAEPVLMSQLAAKMALNARVYLGNSLAIREWELTNKSSETWWFEGNRGANGIDGQLSTFLGFAGEPDEVTENWAWVGDLTALYDLASPWALRSRELAPCTFVVINNGGGQIFRPLLKQKEFINNHNLEFSFWAKMWGLDYFKVDSVAALDALPAPTSPHRVIELVPDTEQSEAWEKQWEELWQNEFARL